MKTAKFTSLSAALILSCQLFSQQPVTQSTVVGNPNTNFWSRTGNAAGSTSENVFGTKWNSPIYTFTNNLLRTKLNGSFGLGLGVQYPVNSWGLGVNFAGINTTGYLLLGPDKPLGFGGTLYNNKGAFSLLHLNGEQGSFVQEAGFRPWMKTGITFTSNQDLAYIGHKQASSGAMDVTDLVFAWSDNPGGSSSVSPDVLKFAFTTGAGTGSGNVADLTGDDIDGREIFRMHPEGRIGIGPQYNNYF